MGAEGSRCHQCLSRRPPDTGEPSTIGETNQPAQAPAPKVRPLGSKVAKAMGRLGNQRPSGGFSSEEGRISMPHEDVANRLRSLAAQIESPGKSWFIAGIYEHQALKVGLRSLDEAWSGVDISVFPTGKDALTKESLFQKLLSEEIQLKSILGADLVAAQPDLKRLSLVQLLRLRVLLLDFVPSGAGNNGVSAFSFQSSHETFIRMLEGLLFDRLGQKAVEHVRVTGESFSEFGRDAVLMVAAATAILTPTWWCWWLPLSDSRRVFFNVASFGASDSFPSEGALEVDKRCRIDRQETTGSLRQIEWQVRLRSCESELHTEPPLRCKTADLADLVSPKALQEGRERLRST